MPSPAAMPAPAIAKRSRLSGRPTADTASMGDQELARRHLAGHPEAGVELVSRWRRGLIGYFVNQIHDEETAEDLAHDVLAKALQSLHRVDTRRPVWPWLMSIARNHLTDHYRRLGTAKDPANTAGAEAVIDLTEPQDVDHLVEVIDATCDRATLQRAIGRLTPRQQFAILRHDVDDWTSDQIADALGTNRNAVHQMLLRARRTTKREYLKLTGGRAPWALAPWPAVWLRDRARRALTRLRSTVQEWHQAVPTASEAVAVSTSMAITVTVVAGLSWVGVGGGVPPAQATPQGPAEDLRVALVVEQLPSDRPAGGSTDLITWKEERLSGSHESGLDQDAAVGTEESADPVAHLPDASVPETPLPDDGVDTPTGTASMQTSESDHYDDGFQVEDDVNVGVDDDVQPIDGGTSGSTDVNCENETTSTLCDPEGAAEDTATVDDIETEQDVPASNEVDEVEEDASEVEVLTEDNCSLDETLMTVCDSVNES